MFNTKTLPNIVVKELTYKNIDVLLDKSAKDQGIIIYTLYNNGIPWMRFNRYSNKEIKEFYSQYDMAYGDVLLTGFGFGILASWIASKPEVNSVTVLEVSQDIVDVFLMNNVMPDKVSVIITDASNYKTDKHYDCLFLDHYEENHSMWIMRNIKEITSNIPNHDIFWFWSAEMMLLETSPDHRPLLQSHSSFNNILDHRYIDFSKIYENFKNNILNIPTFPNLDKNTINKYGYTYLDRIAYSL